MILFANKGFQTRSDCPDTDWTGEALYIVADGTPLAQKICSLYPNFDFVTENGRLVDVVEIAPELPAEPPEPEPPTLEERVEALESGLLAVLGV